MATPAQLRAEIDRLRLLVLTAVDVLLRAERDDEAAGFRSGAGRRTRSVEHLRIEAHLPHARSGYRNGVRHRGASSLIGRRAVLRVPLRRRDM